MTGQLLNSPPIADLVVSVIIPTYGRPERLRQLLAQLLDQDAGFAYEMIVVDDGSPDPVAPLVQACGEKAAVPVRCLRKPNEGPASARNFGAQAAAGEFFLFVDDDISVPSDFIRIHMETQREAGPGLVSCVFEWQVDEQPEPFARWLAERMNRWRNRRISGLSLIEDEIYAIGRGTVDSNNISIRRLDFEQVGGFDTGYRAASCEDQDFGLRLKEAGLPLLVTGRTIVQHVKTSVTIEEVCRRQAMGAADTVRFVRRFATRCGQPVIATVNGPIRWGLDPWPLAMKKILKPILLTPPFSWSIFGLMRLLERVSPESDILGTVYDLIIGAHIQRGWREGLKRYGSVAPLKLKESPGHP